MNFPEQEITFSHNATITCATSLLKCYFDFSKTNFLYVLNNSCVKVFRYK